MCAALGLATCPVGLASMFGQEIVPEAIGMGDDEQFLIAVPIGFPAEEVDVKPREDKCKFL